MDIEELRKLGREQGAKIVAAVHVVHKQPDPPASIDSALAILLKELPAQLYSQRRSGFIFSFSQEKQADEVAAAVQAEVEVDQPGLLRVEVFPSKRVSDYCYLPIVRVWGTGDVYGMVIFKNHAPVAVLREADNAEIMITSLLPEKPAAH